uniref:Fibronectin type-III domain-containing protein n=1 Tax=Macrostomum lignano TaxID=282301 RepID=A0A1I8H7Z9_9PLAT
SRLLIIKSRLLIIKSRLLIIKGRPLISKSRLLIIKSRLPITKSRLLIAKSRLLIIKSLVAAAQTEKSKADDGNKATNDTPKEPSTIAKHPPAIRARPTPGSSTMIDLTLSDDEADNTTSAANSRKRPQAVISGAATASSQSADNQPSVASVAASSDNRSHGNSESHDGTSSAKRSRTDSSILPSLDAVLETSNQESHLYVPPFTLPALSEVTSMVSNRIFRLERDVRFLKEKLDKQQNKMRSLLTMNRRLDTEILMQKNRSLPAPLPVTPAPLSAVSTSKLPPSRATLTLERTPEGVTLQWDLTDVSHLHAGVKAYEIWSYSEVLDERQPRRRQPPSCPWAKVGDVKALPLPMSCSLTQIEAGSMFHFAVRALDVYNRFGRWSNVCSVPVPLQAVRPSPGSSAANMRTGSQQQFMGTVLRA